MSGHLVPVVFHPRLLEVLPGEALCWTKLEFDLAEVPLLGLALGREVNGVSTGDHFPSLRQAAGRK
jgi:hypothetical protein